MADDAPYTEYRIVWVSSDGGRRENSPSRDYAQMKRTFDSLVRRGWYPVMEARTIPPWRRVQ